MNQNILRGIILPTLFEDDDYEYEYDDYDYDNDDDYVRDDDDGDDGCRIFDARSMTVNKK